MASASAVLKAVSEAAPAAAATGAMGIVGSLATAPAWLLALGQALVVVYFTVRGVEKRMSRLHTAVNETTGALEELRGRVNALPCHQPDFRCQLAPVQLTKR